MSETQVLLSKIAALRQRLEQAAGLANEARSAAAALLESAGGDGASLPARVAAGGAHDELLDQAVRPVTGTSALEGDRSPPRTLTARARRVLEQGREMLGQLRDLADEFAAGEGKVTGETVHLLTPFYRETVSMIDTALRTVALLPDSATAQLHLCAGLEATLQVVAGRLRTLHAGTARQRYEGETVARLAGMLATLAAGRPIEIHPFRDLADEILAEVNECAPLRFLEGDPSRPAHFAACHGLTVARVAARVVRHDPHLRQRCGEAVLAALLHDAGMARLPAELLSYPGAFDGEARRILESHSRIGAELVAPLLPDQPWLAEAAEHHHERLDGTGYPDGLRGQRLSALTRFVAVCDVYAALCVRRPHRPARATRTALADTLLLAEQGQLDPRWAEFLLHLSFYPVGSVVELAHGAIGVVVATPAPGPSLNAPARPVVALLTDAAGVRLPRPLHIDLGKCDGYSIVRTLTAQERQDLFRQVPEWAA